MEKIRSGLRSTCWAARLPDPNRSSMSVPVMLLRNSVSAVAFNCSATLAAMSVAFPKTSLIMELLRALAMSPTVSRISLTWGFIEYRI